MNETMTTAAIEADPKVPIIRITRDFAATPAQLFRAHTDPKLFVRWVGPDGMTTTLDRWDARTGGSWRYVAAGDGMEFGFHGCFHEVRPDRIVQTFTWEGEPDGVALETLIFEDLGDGRAPHPGGEPGAHHAMALGGVCGKGHACAPSSVPAISPAASRASSLA